MRYDPTSRKKLFIAIRHDSALLAPEEYSLVRARKIGLPPSGSTIGNSALRIRNRFFPTSAISFLPASEYSRVLLPPRRPRSLIATLRAARDTILKPSIFPFPTPAALTSRNFVRLSHRSTMSPHDV